MAGRERRGEVLVELPDGPEGAGRERYLRRLRRWPDRLPRGDPHGLSADESAEFTGRDYEPLLLREGDKLGVNLREIANICKPETGAPGQEEVKK